MMLTRSEVEIMEVLWKEGKPLTSSDIINLSENRTWKKSYVHLLLNSLLSKDMIEVVGFVKTTKNYARTFDVKISKEEYSVNQFTNMQSFKETDIPKIVAALIDKTDNDEIFKELEEMIEQRKAKCIEGQK